MADNYIPDLVIRNAKIRARNFSGRERVYNGRVVNAQGKRNFMVELDPDMAEKLEADGWNVRWRRDPNDPEARISPALSVDATFGKYPPEVQKKTRSGYPVRLEEDDMDALDHDQIVEANVVIHGRAYTTAAGQTGVKAWLRRLLIVVEDDPFADYFAGMPGDKADDVPFDL